MAGLGHVPFALFPAALLGFALLARLTLVARDPWSAARAGWLAGIGYFATTLHWIVEPFLVDVARHGWMAPFALLFAATGFALFWGAACGLARLSARGGWPLALGFTAAMGLAGLARGTLLTGFPWALPGYVWTETPAAQIAAVTGSYGLSALTVGLGALVALGGARGPVRTALLLAVALALPFGIGAAMLRSPAAADGPVVRVVQPNAPQDEKWLPGRAEMFFQRQLGFTAAPPAGAPPALTLWPETAVSFLLEPGLPQLAAIAEAGGDAPVAFGTQRIAGPRAYNSLALVGGDGAIIDVYDKHHLVPFGEYIPLGGLARQLGLRGLAERTEIGFSAGPGPRLIDLGPLGRALPLICYEAVFPRDVAAAPARPDLLLQVTNDAWFGTFSGPYQHLAQARMRAIEQGLPLVRSANTGVSAMIDAQGRITASLDLGEAGWFDAVLPPPGPPTPYARMGDGPVLAILLAALAAAAARGRRFGD